MKNDYFKRRYFDLRIGQSIIFPAISMINFIIISYSLTSVSKVLPIEYYAPLILSSLIITLVLVGNQFRSKQQSTDIKLVYEKNTEHVKTMLVLLKAQRSNTPNTDLEERIKFHERILNES